ncbi:uncharacterized protein LOC109726683 [Ananas comosus]|uniref:U5 small nuclear ribonucleoprotein TSSC4 n=1 Tax=Ananas comosus TaxID=4615 RepID=A0A6P5GVW0_ANACO|nr:uncharacterized protein LOC109726683 [Ananas comosus]
MEESFEVRVKRLFGSRLFETVPGNSFPASSWSVADGEVERREWNRGGGGGGGDDAGGGAADRGDAPCSAAFDDPAGCFARRARNQRRRSRGLGADLEADLDDVNDADEDVEGGGGGGDGDGEGEGDGDREEREIRSSVGLDPTLDNEEEEDEFDRAAFGAESARNRLYMREVKDRGRHISIHTVVPELFDDPFDDSGLFYRDPRADHDAANVRLMEDDKSAEKDPSLSVHSSSRPKIIPEDEANLKPILKRKENRSDEKPKKRVRFDSELLERTEHCNNAAKEENPSASLEPSRVPDYILNPSKYTKYTLDSSDSNDDKMNKQAFEDFRNLMDRLNPNNNTETQPDIPTAELTKSITFIPRKKAGGGGGGGGDDAMCIDEAATHAKAIGSKSSGSMFIAAEDAREADVCEMEEDRAEALAGEVGLGSSKKAARRYRAKPADDSG